MVLETKLTSSKVREILAQQTTIGNPRIKGTPFARFTDYESQKPFFGKINKSDFEITYNTIFFPIPFYISGKYQTINDKTIIEFEIKKIKFGYYCYIIGIPIGILLMTFLMIKTGEIPILIMIIFDLILVLMFALTSVFIRNRKAKLISTLKTVLENS